ncbi:Dihydroneopterin aldolase [Candidatus Burkholderia pumila]|uniref:dihydroneopterin aldolase n=1 Tax=Candidatus Burkholderia pumila TaxID=1090375 RepID=A0ABR5HNZ2_9BURK|nr:Dihydroneopterin aldolase [Candidatus Burkholderia pumila]
MDIVYIEGLAGNTVIGIDRSELHEPQPVCMNLAIGVPSLKACTTDRIEDTVNYAAVREAILALLESHRVQLLEALAERIAQLVIADFGAYWVRIPDVDAVGVVIERRHSASRAQSPVSLAWIGRGYVRNEFIWRRKPACRFRKPWTHLFAVRGISWFALWRDPHGIPRRLHRLASHI